ncbi:MAG: hypothetical protein R3B09_06145 [Nannocystaceae bacterium]
MTEIFGGKRLYVSGKFEGLQQGEVWAYLLGHGAQGTTSRSGAQGYLCADPSDPKLVATGKPLYTLADLGAPLAGYLDRVKAAVESRRAELLRYKKPLVTHLGYGPPADDALIAKVADALGFPVPDDLLTLMRQFNGLSAAVAMLKRGGDPIELSDDGPLPYCALASMSHPLWRGRIDWLLGVIGIPTWEDIFLRPQAERLCDAASAYPPKSVIAIGPLKVKSEALFPRLFAFDLFHHWAGAALYADPKAQALRVIYAFDVWADFTSAHPLSLRGYMESLAAGLWGRAVHVGQRYVRPTRSSGWPTYVRNIHGAPYVFLEFK